MKYRGQLMPPNIFDISVRFKAFRYCCRQLDVGPTHSSADPKDRRHRAAAVAEFQHRVES